MDRQSGRTRKINSEGAEVEFDHSHNTCELSQHPDEDRRIAQYAKLFAKRRKPLRDTLMFIRDTLLKLWLYVVGDLYEEYENIKAGKGEWHAKLWCCLQVVRSVGPLLWVAVKIILRALLPEEYRKYIP